MRHGTYTFIVTSFSNMKVGDLVRLRRKMKFMTKEDWGATGIILREFSGGSHRKNTSYEILWSVKSTTLPTWHTSSTLELVK